MTGASSGMGKQFALQLSAYEQVDEIWAIARRKEALEALNGQCGAKVRPVCLDLGKEESFREYAALLEQEKPEVKLLVNAAGFGTAQETVLPAEIVTAVEDCGFFESIPLWAVTLIGGLFITVLSFIMIMSVYGRFFKLYLYTAIAPVPLSSLRESRARMSAGALSRVIVPCALRVQSSCLPALSFRCLRLPRPWSIPMRLRSRWCGAISGNWYSICSSLSVRSRWQTVSCVK